VNPDVNDPPTAVDDFATVVRNSTNFFINLVGNDTDPDGNINPNSIVIVTPPTRGGTAVAVTNGVLYTPKTNFRGTETFTYTVRDLGTPPLVSNVATVRVNVVKP